MGVRESLNKHQGFAVGAVTVLAAAAGVFAWRNTPEAPRPRPAEAAQAFYSADDGASFFAAPADLVPPFDWQGKIACRAAVYTCDGGRTKFVAYLEKYPPAAKTELDAAREAMKRTGADAGPPPMSAGDVEVKKPGATAKWVSRRSPAAGEVLKVSCPPGVTGMPEPVLP